MYKHSLTQLTYASETKIMSKVVENNETKNVDTIIISLHRYNIIIRSTT